MVCSKPKCVNLKHSMICRPPCVVSLVCLVFAAVWLSAQNPQPAESDVVGEVYASDASVQGSVIFASGGTRLLSGSTVSSGTASTALRLSRGGEVRICPGSNVQVNSVVNQSQERNLVLSLDTGGLEASYSLPSGSDSVVTPDFRITLVGPGEFQSSMNSWVRAAIRSSPTRVSTFSMAGSRMRLRTLQHADVRLPRCAGRQKPRSSSQ